MLFPFLQMISLLPELNPNSDVTGDDGDDACSRILSQQQQHPEAVERRISCSKSIEKRVNQMMHLLHACDDVTADADVAVVGQQHSRLSSHCC
jgi:hypothetical protein